MLRYVATKTPGLGLAVDATSTSTPDATRKSQGSAVAAHAAHERTARPVDKPLHRAIWPKLKVNDCACRHALHYLASYVYSGDYAAHYTPGGSAKDRHMSRERKIQLCLKLCLPTSGQEGLSTLHRMWKLFRLHDARRKKKWRRHRVQRQLLALALGRACWHSHLRKSADA